MIKIETKIDFEDYDNEVCIVSNYINDNYFEIYNWGFSKVDAKKLKSKEDIGVWKIKQLK